MEKNDTILLIEGAPFQIQQTSGLLQDYNNPANTIDVKHYIPDQEGNISFPYNRSTKNIAIYTSPAETDNVTAVKIPFDLFIDQQNEIDKTAEVINLRSQLLNHGIYVLNSEMRQRLEGKLPQIKISDTSFTADVLYGVLRQTDNPSNILYFNKMVNKGDHYAMIYEPMTKKQVLGAPGSNYAVLATISPMVDIDPLGMSYKYNIPPNRMPARDEDFQCDQSLLERRLQSHLPFIKIADDKFIINSKNGELQYASAPDKILKYSDMDSADGGNKLQFLYDIDSKTIAPVPDNWDNVSKGLLYVEIPNPVMLDPVGMAKEAGINPRSFVNDFPIQKELPVYAVRLIDTQMMAAHVSRSEKQIQHESKQHHHSTKSTTLKPNSKRTIRR